MLFFSKRFLVVVADVGSSLISHRSSGEAASRCDWTNQQRSFYLEVTDGVYIEEIQSQPRQYVLG
jgi:hypothetical protein